MMLQFGLRENHLLNTYYAGSVAAGVNPLEVCVCVYDARQTVNNSNGSFHKS